MNTKAHFTFDAIRRYETIASDQYMKNVSEMKDKFGHTQLPVSFRDLTDLYKTVLLIQ